MRFIADSIILILILTIIYFLAEARRVDDSDFQIVQDYVQDYDFDTSQYQVATSLEMVKQSSKKSEKHLVSANTFIGTTQDITDYVKRFYPTAVAENVIYNIPISIKLAQGILESSCGKSKIAIRANNHFGIKHRQWPEDMQTLVIGKYTCHEGDFTSFITAWSSWRAHSIVLQAKRYQNLYMTDDYMSWAYGLEHYGYAEDPQYAEKLINVIEREKLYLFD